MGMKQKCNVFPMSCGTSKVTRIFDRRGLWARAQLGIALFGKGEKMKEENNLHSNTVLLASLYMES
jgi:hypothetical protein